MRTLRVFAYIALASVVVLTTFILAAPVWADVGAPMTAPLTAAVPSVAPASTAPTSTAPAPAPLRTDPIESMVKVLFALGFVVAAIFAVAWMFRRVGGLTGVASGSLRIVGGLSLGGRERVVLVQVGEQQILLGVAPGRIQSLHVLPAPIEVAKSTFSADGFAAKLQAAITQRKKP